MLDSYDTNITLKLCFWPANTKIFSYILEVVRPSSYSVCVVMSLRDVTSFDKNII